MDNKTIAKEQIEVYLQIVETNHPQHQLSTLEEKEALKILKEEIEKLL